MYPCKFTYAEEWFMSLTTAERHKLLTEYMKSIDWKEMMKPCPGLEKLLKEFKVNEDIQYSMPLKLNKGE